ncbi:DUF2231 domain-containing protein [Kribbella deserti]|uniref:DUF2231 domain-containing protein n=1 Tax=Kribbella deserti TaxID=1926257 RepID=A0ABV6QHN8_9ACTN
MESRAKALGHAVHPVLIVFPLGLLSTAVIFDVLYLITDRASFATSAGHTMAAGIIGGVVAAVFGLIDWLVIPKGTRARRIGSLHGLGNAAVLVLFVISWLLRFSHDNWDPGMLAVICSVAGVGLAGATGWLGGELVERLGIGVDEGANVNAPSSLTQKHPAKPA